MSRRIPARTSRRLQLRRRQLMKSFDCLEPRWMMASTTPDTYFLQSLAPTYDQPFFVEAAQPAQQTLGPDGKLAYDLRVNTPGDQSIPIQGVTRIRIDPLASYQVTLITQAGEGNFLVESFDATGTSLGKTTIPYDFDTSQSAVYDLVTSRAHIGPSGRMLPLNTATIETTAAFVAPKFGFLEDQVHSFRTNRSSDRGHSPNAIRIDMTRPTIISYEAIRHSPSTSPQVHSLGFESLDVDNELIEGVHVERYSNAGDTRLSQALRPGDTSFVVDSAVGWSNQSLDPRTRALAWYGYRDSKGTLYPDYTYTRNVAKDSIDGLWDPGAVVGNRITLRKPWTGPIIPAGTAVRNAVDSDSLIPSLLESNRLLSSGRASIIGTWSNGVRTVQQFPPGTSSIRLASITNQSSVSEDETISIQMRFGLPHESAEIVSPVNRRRVFDLSVLSNDSLTSGAQIRSVTQGVRGTVTIVPGTGSVSSKLRYTSSEFFIGTDYFTYTVVDPVTFRESTEQVFLQSLGGNLDQNPALQEAIRVDGLTPTLFRGNINIGISAVKNERFVSEDADVERWGPHDQKSAFVTFRGMQVHTGSLSLLPNGKFEFEPLRDFVGTTPLLFDYQNGSSLTIGAGGVTVHENHFLREQTRLRNIGLMEHNFESAFKRFFYPANVAVDANNKPFLSWRVYALQFSGASHRELFHRFKLNEPWNSPNNLPLLAEMPNLYRSGTDSSTVTSTRYLAIADGVYPGTLSLFLNNVNSLGNKLQLSQVTDGLVNTILVVQAAPEKAVPWTKPDDLVFDPANPIATLGNVGSYFNAVFADGTVRTLPTDMGNAMFESLVTINRGDLLRDPASLTRAAKPRADYPGDPTVYNDTYQSNAMKQLLLSMHNHESAYKRLVPSLPINAPRNLSWRVHLLPFLEQSTLYSQFRLDEPWDSPHNLALAEKMPDIFRSLGDSPTSTQTRFRVLGGANMAYGSASSLNQGPRFSEFTDGTSHSILLVEAGADKAVPWTQPDVMPIAAGNIWDSLGQFANGNMLVGMADGSVLRIPMTTPPDIVRGLTTINLQDAGRSEFELYHRNSYEISMYHQSNNFKQIGLSIHNFESAFKRLPSDFLGFSNRIPPDSVGLSWRVAILPFMEESTLYYKFRLDEPWDSPHNLALLPLIPSVYRTATDLPGTTTTRVQRFRGQNTIDPKQRITLGSITDGTSNTVMVALTAPENAVPWTKPEDMPFSDTSGWEALGRKVKHTPIVLADGSVKSLDRSIGDVALKALVLRNDGKALSGLDANLNEDPPRTMLVREGGPVDAITVRGSLPVVFDFDHPTLAIASVRSDGAHPGFGASLRVSVQANINSSVDGKRQTKLNIRTRSNPSDPNSALNLLYSIDVIILDQDGISVQTTTPLPMFVGEGAATTVAVRLSSQPFGNVIVQARESDSTEVQLPTQSFVFTPFDWNIPQAVVVVGVVEPVLDGDVDSEIQFSIASGNHSHTAPLIVPVRTLDNRPATITLQNPVSSLPENSSTTARIAVGQVSLVDDGVGFNTLSLSGPDAGMFQLENGTLYLRSGAVLDFETKNRLVVILSADDLAVAGSPDSTLTHVLSITDANDPPQIRLSNVVSELAESTDTSFGLRVASIEIVDDALGRNTVSLGGIHANRFEIKGSELWLKPNTHLDFETKSSLTVFVNVDDPSSGGSPDDSESLVLNITDVNEPPTLSLANQIESIRESHDTSSGFFVAKLEVRDDALGTNEVRLSGPDAEAFEWTGSQLLLKPNTPLDFESKTRFVVHVSVDDPTIGTSPDFSIEVTLLVSDVNERPALGEFKETIQSIRENSSTALKTVAQIVIVDDAMGNNLLTINGADARHFRLNGTSLEFQPLGTLDYESQSKYEITISLTDPSISGTPLDTRPFQLSLINVPEIVSVTDPFGNAISESSKAIRVQWDTLVEAAAGSIRWWKQDVQMDVPSTVTSDQSSTGSTFNLAFSDSFLRSGKLPPGEYQLVVDGIGVRSQVSQTVADPSQSGTIRVEPALLPTTLQLRQLRPAKANEPTPIEVRVADANADRRYTLRVDSNNDGIHERTFVDVLTPFVIEDLRFDRAGVQTIRVMVESQSTVQASEELAIPVTSWRGGAANNWLSGIDTDRDGSVSPLDVLTIVNHINARDVGGGTYDFVLDVDRDATIGPLDVLGVVNHLNRSTPDSSPFRSLQMSNTGSEDGYTSSAKVIGELANPKDSLFLSLDGGTRRNASSLIQANGAFEVTDQAIRELFGDVPDGEHTISAFTHGSAGFSIARDRRFILQSQNPPAPSITAAMQMGNEVYLEWKSEESGFHRLSEHTYTVYIQRHLENPISVVTKLASDSAIFLHPGSDFEVYVEAVSASNLRTRSRSIHVRRT